MTSGSPNQTNPVSRTAGVRGIIDNISKYTEATFKIFEYLAFICAIEVIRRKTGSSLLAIIEFVLFVMAVSVVSLNIIRPMFIPVDRGDVGSFWFWILCAVFAIIYGVFAFQIAIILTDFIDIIASNT